MSKRAILVTLVATALVAVSAVAIAQNHELPTPEEVHEANLQEFSSGPYQPDTPDNYDGLRSGDGAEDEATTSLATPIATLVTHDDGCGDASGGEADIDDVVVELEDDGDWRYTVNLCGAHDLTNETGWQFFFATAAYDLDDSTSESIPVTTYIANLTHNDESLIFGPVFEPDAVVNYADGAGFLGTGRPDKATLRCGEQFGVSADRFYTPSVGAATSFTIDIDPACWNHASALFLGINAPGDDLDLEAGTLTASGFPATGRVAGGDRFETAAEMSRRAFPRGGSYFLGAIGAMLFPESFGQIGATLTVYLTNGLNFPDALGGSSFMANGTPTFAGPILYYNKNSDTVPNATLGEICRIQPDQIVALGGVNAVSDAALAAAQAAAEADDCSVYGLP